MNLSVVQMVYNLLNKCVILQDKKCVLNWILSEGWDKPQCFLFYLNVAFLQTNKDWGKSFIIRHTFWDYIFKTFAGDDYPECTNALLNSIIFE